MYPLFFFIIDKGPPNIETIFFFLGFHNLLGKMIQFSLNIKFIRNFVHFDRNLKFENNNKSCTIYL